MKENFGNTFEECLYYRSEDIFLINLIYPDDKEKIKEFNPMLSWVANYAFANELTYRIRVAEIKQGQNPVNAVMRNEPMYDENNLMQNSIIYPVYAKPLQVNQPYAWTVDAYYKGILLGGAETWQFIIPDTTPVQITGSRSYIDVKREHGTVQLYALGDLKLKYQLEKFRSDTLVLQLFHEDKKIELKQNKLNAIYGDNRYTLDLLQSNLKHMGSYKLLIRSTNTGECYALPFKYVNPEFSH